MARIAFIGVGKMGLGMAGRLLAAGHQLNVYNRTPAKAAPLVGRGARLCASPAEACEEAEAVISMVADDAASREVLTWRMPGRSSERFHTVRRRARRLSAIPDAWSRATGITT